MRNSRPAIVAKLKLLPFLVDSTTVRCEGQGKIEGYLVLVTRSELLPLLFDFMDEALWRDCPHTPLLPVDLHDGTDDGIPINHVGHVG